MGAVCFGWTVKRQLDNRLETRCRGVRENVSHNDQEGNAAAATAAPQTPAQYTRPPFSLT